MCLHTRRPLLGWNAIHRLYLYVNEGHNSLIVVGGPASALFINNNVINKDGGYDLEPKWAPGPYERQSTVDATPFAACATTLPGPGTQVAGPLLPTALALRRSCCLSYPPALRCCQLWPAVLLPASVHFCPPRILLTHSGVSRRCMA
jgi:hypothetical protein